VNDPAHRFDVDGERVPDPAEATPGAGPARDAAVERLRFARQLADAVGPDAVDEALAWDAQAAPVTERLVLSPPAGAARPGDRPPARAVSTGDPDPGEPADPEGPPVLPALRAAVFGAGRTDAGPGPGGPGAGPEMLALPPAPALVCDGADRIVRVNAALLQLAGRPAGSAGELHAGPGDPVGLIGMRLAELVVGPDTDARLVRRDGALVRVRVVRWVLPGRELRAVVLVELGDGPDRSAEVARTDRRWVTELERLAGVGTWSVELADGTLRRSETLVELYRAVGLDPDDDGEPIESEQVALLCRALRRGAVGADGGPPDHHAELRLPGDRLLSCRAEVEADADGRPVRLVGVVRDLTPQRRVEHAGRRFADLAELVPSGVALVDRDGVVVDANPALCTLLDTPLSSLRGTPAAALAAEPPLPGPVAGGLPPWLRPVAPGARHAYRVDAAPLLRADGTTVWCEVAATVSVADDGSWFWLVVCTDVGNAAGPRSCCAAPAPWTS
jgi:PAS domain-containing protein